MNAVFARCRQRSPQRGRKQVLSLSQHKRLRHRNVPEELSGENQNQHLHIPRRPLRRPWSPTLINRAAKKISRSYKSRGAARVSLLLQVISVPIELRLSNAEERNS